VEVRGHLEKVVMAEMSVNVIQGQSRSFKDSQGHRYYAAVFDWPFRIYVQLFSNYVASDVHIVKGPIRNYRGPDQIRIAKLGRPKF